ncbi:MAG TPA: GNAT family N-acetyltransferase [Flavobacteriaceae bacterium]|jgi:GNAT superfamily N-acetyltransferase
MITFKRTDSTNQDFIDLVNQLDSDLTIRDGDDHAFYHQFNSIGMIKYAIVAYQEHIPIGCGAIKAFDPITMEVKRMYVSPDYRGKGIAGKILIELEHWTKQLGCKRCILETGINQPEALALYHKSGFKRIPNYGQYVNVTSSFCFEKVLAQ